MNGQRAELTLDPRGKRLSRRVAVGTGILGTLLGVATNLYSAEFRAAIESPRALGAEVVSALVAAVVASGSTAIAYWWAGNRNPSSKAQSRSRRTSCD